MAEDRILYNGDFLRLKQRGGHWEYAERAKARAAVMLVAVTDSNELLLVEQWRAPIAANVIELPAGLVGDIAGEEDEELTAAAARELEEETGYRAATFDFLAAGPPSAGMANEVVAFYRARGLEKVGPGGGDANEQITVHTVGLAEIDAWLADRYAQGVQVDPKIYAGLYFVRRG
jgi:ADP-ribose pyrophosphatase